MKVGIVGGSVAGLAAAAELAALGLEVSVFERSTADLTDRGAGISLDPAVARQIGLGRGVEIFGRVIIGTSGRELWRRRAAKVVTSWSEVYTALRKRVNGEWIQPGRRVTKCLEEDGGSRLLFADGSEAVFDLVLGADGVGSVVRDAVAPGFAPEYCGYVAVRGMIPEDALPTPSAPLRELADNPGLINCYGPRTHLVAYWAPRGEGRALNWMWYRNTPADELNDILRDESGFAHRWSLPPGKVRPEWEQALLGEMREIFPECVWRAAEAAPTISQQAIFRGVPETFSRGRILLVGDAAAVAVPHIGAGVSLAVQDVTELSSRWNPADIDASIAAWSAERRATVFRILEVAAALGRSVQHEDHDWASWRPEDFESWWEGITAGHGLYFEKPHPVDR